MATLGAGWLARQCLSSQVQTTEGIERRRSVEGLSEGCRQMCSAFAGRSGSVTDGTVCEPIGSETAHATSGQRSLEDTSATY